CHVAYASTSYGTGGRGPTSDISPCRTLNSCGSSSRLERRRNFPTAVIRGSLVSLNTPAPLPLAGFLPAFPSINWRTYSRCSLESLFTYIERNFKNVKGVPCSPIRFCRNSTGPRDVSL